MIVEAKILAILRIERGQMSIVGHGKSVSARL